MQLDITITANPDSGINKLLSKLADPTAALDPIGRYMLQQNQVGFDTETDPTGQAWKPLSVAYLESKRRDGFIESILQRTGTMKAEVFYEVGTNEVKLIAPTEYARDVQADRPFMGLGDGDVMAIVDLFAEYLRG